MEAIAATAPGDWEFLDGFDGHPVGDEGMEGRTLREGVGDTDKTRREEFTTSQRNKVFPVAPEKLGKLEAERSLERRAARGQR